jgi:hypothetical protein
LVSEGTTFGGRRSHVTIEVIWSHKCILHRDILIHRMACSIADGRITW